MDLQIDDERPFSSVCIGEHTQCERTDGSAPNWSGSEREADCRRMYLNSRVKVIDCVILCVLAVDTAPKKVSDKRLTARDTQKKSYASDVQASLEIEGSGTTSSELQYEAISHSPSAPEVEVLHPCQRGSELEGVICARCIGFSLGFRWWTGPSPGSLVCI